MPELAFEQWIIIAKDLLNKEVTVLRTPYENQTGIVIDIWADNISPRTVNVELTDGTFLTNLKTNEYKKI